MRSYWLAPILLSPLVSGEVIQAPVLHFQSKQAGPFQPLITMGIGEPPQDITCIFDTGSSDLIVPEANSAVCNVPNEQCDRKSQTGFITGQFDPEEANDVEPVNNEFNADFSGGDQFSGPIVKTDVNIGGTTVPATQIGLAEEGQPAGDFPQFPICGVGPVGNEAAKKNYPNLLPTMKKSGAIEGNVMSMLFSPKPNETGDVFFGGIDTEKFTGDLQEIDLLPIKDGPKAGQVTDFVVEMTGVSVQLGGGKNDKNRRRALQRRAQILRNTGGHRVVGRRKSRRSITWRSTGRYSAIEGNNTSDQPHTGQQEKRSDGGAHGGNKQSTQGKKSAKQGRDGNNQGEGGNDDGRGQNNGGGGGGKGQGNDNNLGLQQGQGFTLLDTGGVGLALPAPQISQLAKAMGIEPPGKDAGDLGPVDCGMAKDAKSKLLMQFGEARAEIPLSNILTSPDILADNEKDLCFLQIRPAEDNGGEILSVMGFPWFSSMFTVFDLENNKIMMAPGKQDATGSDLREISAKKSAKNSANNQARN